MSGNVCCLGRACKCNFFPLLKGAVTESVKTFQKKPPIPEALKEAFWVNKDINIIDGEGIVGYHGTSFKAIEGQLAKGKLEQRGKLYLGSLDTAAHFALRGEDPVVVVISSPKASISDVELNEYGRAFLPNHPGFEHLVIPISASRLNPDYVDYRLNPSRRGEELLKNRFIEITKPLKSLLKCSKVKKVAFVVLALVVGGIALSTTTSKAKKE